MRSVLYQLLIVCSVQFCYGQQSDIAIRFNETVATDASMICYDIEVSQMTDQPVSLASQNYRFYYDARSLRFLRELTTSHLMEGGYNRHKVLQAVHNSNASGFGNLDFSENLGFVNIVVSDIGIPEQQKMLKKGEWLKCLNTCFEVDADDSSRAIVWARKDLTDGYATAFTSISTSLSGLTFSATISNHIDIQEVSGNQADRMAATEKK